MDLSTIMAMYGNRPGAGSDSTGVGVGTPAPGASMQGGYADPGTQAMQQQMMAKLLMNQGQPQQQGGGVGGAIAGIAPSLASMYMQHLGQQNQVASNQGGMDNLMQQLQSQPMPTGQ